MDHPYLSFRTLKWVIMSLMRRFYNDPYLHIRSFSVTLGVSLLLCAGAFAAHSPEFYHFHFALWELALIPVGIYIGGISAVFIHNASHGSFGPAWLNKAAGELSGMHQLWGFMGWKLIHLIHHHYSDDVKHDPHPPKSLDFWDFTKNMFLHSSINIRERYREHWGMTRRTQRLQKSLLVVFLALAVSNLIFWYALCGPAGFVFFYVPSYIANHLLFAHINYFAHPKDTATGQTAPGNMNHTLYYKLANALWFGIYFHGNHHRKPLLFNPRHMAVGRARAVTQEPLDKAA
jgi:fatty acid desaturase